MRFLSPLRFELSDPARAELLAARGPGYTVNISRTGATVTLLVPNAEGTREPVALAISLVGASPVAPSPSRPLPGVSNYFVGASPSAWRTGVRGFGQVTQHELLPGVDMVYYGARGGELEYDLVLAPGVDPATLRLQLDGAVSLQLGQAGELFVGLGHGAQLVKRAPVAYQLVDGQRRSVDVRYELHGKQVGFSVGRLDASRPLVIDPVLSYATFLGAQNYDEIFALTSDRDGSSYVAGYTTGGLFPTASPQQGTYGGGSSDAVVCKLNAAGSAYIFCTYLGGNGADQAYGIAADAAGNTYVTGVTYSSNFPTASAVQGAPGGGGLADAFVTKLSPTGNALLFSTYLGGNQDEFPGGIAIGPSGNAVLAGVTFSPNFPTQAPLDATLGGGSDAFVTSFTPAGNALSYSTFLGGSGDEYGNAIAITPSGDAFVVGSTSSTGFPVVGAYQSTFGGGARDAFVSRINSSGTSLAYSSFLGGAFTDEALGVAVSNGNPVVVGSTTSNNFPVVAAAQPSLASPGLSDGFITRFASGTTLSVSSYVGGSAADSAKGVALDSKGNCYVVGPTASSDLPIVNGSAGQLAYHGAGDVFLAAYNALGTTQYTGYLGGLQLDRVAGISLSLNGQVHVAGSTQSVDFPTVNAEQPLHAGSQDGFILRFPSLSSPSSGVPATAHSHGLALAAAILAVFVLACLQRAVSERA